MEFMCIYEKMFLGFFDLKLPKWDTFEAINEESFVRLLTCPSMFLYNQSELTIFAKFFVKRAVSLLLKCSLLLFREELFMLPLSIKCIPFPLHRFSSFLLCWLISSSRDLDDVIGWALTKQFQFCHSCHFLILTKLDCGISRPFIYHSYILSWNHQWLQTISFLVVLLSLTLSLSSFWLRLSFLHASSIVGAISITVSIFIFVKIFF